MKALTTMRYGRVRKCRLSTGALISIAVIMMVASMVITPKQRARALIHPEYHRAEMYKRPLYPPQLQTVNLIEDHIRYQTGKVITVRSARQTMKNEVSAYIAVRAMIAYKSRISEEGEYGGTYIRTAPSWKQSYFSRKRTELFFEIDPLIDDYKPKSTFTIKVGFADIHFLSSDKTTDVVGDTASILLDIDEAHKVDKGKYQEDFSPMTAFNNVPVVMWGVAADKQDLLYQYLTYNLENDPDCVLQFPAAVWCELLPNYAKHYQEQRDRLGPDHPVIKTQYDLVDVDSIGGYFKPHQIISMLDSDHDRKATPKGRSKDHVCTIDIGGEAEMEEDDPLKKSAGSRDSTVALIWEVNFKKLVNDLPICRLVDIYWWTGKALGESPSGLPGQQEILLKLLNLWKPVKTIVDSRGVGEQIAHYLENRYAGVEPYAASMDSVSEDCYSLLAMVNNDRVKMFRNDGSSEYEEAVKQIKRVKYEIKQHQKMRIVKPGPSGHIDMVKAMTYLGRATTDIRQYGGIFV